MSSNTSLLGRLLLLAFFAVSPLLVVIYIYDHFSFNRDVYYLMYLPYALVLFSYYMNDGGGIWYKAFYCIHFVTFISLSVKMAMQFQDGFVFLALYVTSAIMALVGLVFGYLLLRNKAEDYI